MSRWLVPAAAVLLANAGAGCGSSAALRDGAAGSTGLAGGGGGGGSTGAAGSTGAGGGGGAGGSTTGAGGAGGGGGGAGGAGGGADGGVDAGDGGLPPPCTVTITPVNFASLVDIPAGPSVKLRVRGSISGMPLPAPPVWQWTVAIVANSEPVNFTTPDPDDPSVIEFPVTHDGSYRIDATVSVAPVCQVTAYASGNLMPSADYWVRVTPPLDRPDLPPHEDAITVKAGNAPGQTLYLDNPRGVVINPSTMARTAVPSYVRISSPAHSWTREGDTTNAAFPTSLVDDARSRYDVLVVPLGASASFAPQLLPLQSAASIYAQPIFLDPGVSVTGSVRAASGAVAGATVVLRAGALPSTIGTTAADGSFALLARAGRFSAVIVPPDGAGLPEAHVDATADAGIDLPSAGAAPALRFVWSPQPTTSLAVKLLSGGGAPAPALNVRLETDDGAMPNVGTLALGSSTAPPTLTASGAVRRAGVTDAGGTVTFVGLPRARYRLVALPPASAADALTVVPFDLGQDLPLQTVSLAAKVAVHGIVTSAPANTRILIVEDQPEIGRVLPPVAVAANGAYAVALDPYRAYHLVADPPVGGAASRVPLGAVQTAAAAVDRGQQTFPNMLPFDSQVFTISGGAAVGNALVQVFCLGPGPDCVDRSQVSAKDPLPLIEVVTDARGNFAMWVPDPAPLP